MPQFIRAIYENGVFIPLEIPNLADQQQVKLTIEVGTIEAGTIEETDAAKTNVPSPQRPNDPLAGVRASTGIPDLAENFDDYRLGNRQP